LWAYPVLELLPVEEQDFPENPTGNSMGDQKVKH
jgi:hypothetical protein